MSLRAIIESASLTSSAHLTAVAADEARRLLEVLLPAAGLGPLDDSDQIISLEVSDTHLNVRTRSVQRSTHRDREFSVPAYLLDADDPIHAALLWEAEGRIRAARKAVEIAEEQLRAATRHLHDAMEARARITPARETSHGGPRMHSSSCGIAPKAPAFERRLAFISQALKSGLTDSAERANNWYINNGGKRLDLDEALRRFGAWAGQCEVITSASVLPSSGQSVVRHG